MIVHFVDSNGNPRQEECVSVSEGDHGLYLYEATSTHLEFQIGYVPYDNLSHVEPASDDESE